MRPRAVPHFLTFRGSALTPIPRPLSSFFPPSRSLWNQLHWAARCAAAVSIQTILQLNLFCHCSDPMPCNITFLLKLFISISCLNAAWGGCAVVTAGQERSTGSWFNNEYVQQHININDNPQIIWPAEWCTINNCNYPDNVYDDLTPFDFH